ncbi:MAG: hypothetical protein ACF8XB_20910 [Planctomycetota bacterium JB042]
MTFASAALHVGLGVASFLGVAAAVAAVRPGPSDFVVTDKLRHLRRHPGEFDALLVGSSLVYRHFVPEVIDEVLAERGRPLRTFNLGGPGMKGYELDHVVREALDAAGDSVRVVFVEPSRFTPELIDANRRSARTVRWHTLRQTVAVLRQVAGEPRPAAEKLALAAEHLTLFAWNLTSYGDGPRILLERAGMGAPPQLGAAELERTRGHRALEDEVGEEFDARRRALADDPERYRRRVERLRAGATGGTATAFDRERLRAQVEAIRAAGAEAVYVVSPWPGGAGPFPALRDDGVLPALLTFCDPDAWPEAFRIEARFDANHLTRAAARAFSRTFAEAWADRVDGGERGG